jgi:hypothetical protein
MKEDGFALRKVWIPGSLPREVTLEQLAEDTSALDLINLAADFYPQWLAGYLQHKVAVTRDSGSEISGFRVVREGGFIDCDDTPILRPASGRRFGIDRLVDGCRVQHATKLVKAYADLQPLSQPDHVALQFSVPHYVDASIFTLSGNLSWYRLHRKLYGVLLAMQNLNHFRAAAVMEITAAINDIEKRGLTVTDDALWSVEAPSVLHGLHATPRWLRSPVRSWMVHRVAEMIGDIPPGRAVLHLCATRFNQRAIVRPTSLAILVDFLNQLGDELDRRGLAWPMATLPIAPGDRPAPADEAFYAPLSRLNTCWEVILGVADARYPEQSADGLRAAERALGKVAWGISTACGWADFSAAEMDLTVSLLRDMQNLPHISPPI